MGNAKKLFDHSSETGPVEVYPFKHPLDAGDRGLPVMWVQSKLMKHDCYLGELDGKFNLVVSKAVRKFQNDNRLMVTGVVDRKTWNTLKGI